MPYIPPEVVEQARQIDLLTYLQSCEPQELVRISGNNYTTRTHDSLKISNGKWMWWSQRIGGYNALDYLVKVKGCSFVEAVETLMGKAAVMPSTTVKPKQKTEPKILLLPDKSASTERITEYLFGRGIDYAIKTAVGSHCIIHPKRQHAVPDIRASPAIPTCWTRRNWKSGSHRSKGNASRSTRASVIRSSSWSQNRRVAQQHGFHRCHDGGLEPLPVGGADRQGGQPP